MSEYVKKFGQFLMEQDDALSPDAPPAAGEGTPSPPAVESKVKFTFIRSKKDKQPYFLNTERDFPYYSIGEKDLREFAEHYVTDKKKVDDFVDMVKAKEATDTRPEKKYINLFKSKVEKGDLGNKEGAITVEFDKNGEPFTDKLDVNFVFVE